MGILSNFPRFIPTKGGEGKRGGGEEAGGRGKIVRGTRNMDEQDGKRGGTKGRNLGA